ncbi:hypothetical protein STCU_11577 [Strigomonas culicis]|uniref:Uncharacterized protein n=1 Tax=Strigomonas culicis TaxID=28005 RepID=S9TGN1_9TRYP|nr:hypothetical protein STCU_11577 [Strigomonas culicis]|eukprot:EPY16059.1 hypothetical protein STCU_11577 [Strigomonas culicis]
MVQQNLKHDVLPLRLVGGGDARDARDVRLVLVRVRVRRLIPAEGQRIHRVRMPCAPVRVRRWLLAAAVREAQPARRAPMLQQVRAARAAAAEVRRQQRWEQRVVGEGGLAPAVHRLLQLPVRGGVERRRQEPAVQAHRLTRVEQVLGSLAAVGCLGVVGALPPAAALGQRGAGGGGGDERAARRGGRPRLRRSAAEAADRAELPLGQTEVHEGGGLRGGRGGAAAVAGTIGRQRRAAVVRLRRAQRRRVAIRVGGQRLPGTARQGHVGGAAAATRLMAAFIRGVRGERDGQDPDDAAAAAATAVPSRRAAAPRGGVGGAAAMLLRSVLTEGRRERHGDAFLLLVGVLFPPVGMVVVVLMMMMMMMPRPFPSSRRRRASAAPRLPLPCLHLRGDDVHVIKQVLPHADGCEMIHRARL